MMKRYLLAAAAATLAFAAPAAAQESSFEPGVYWDVGMIDIEDGKGEQCEPSPRAAAPTRPFATR
jgi:hypothetical protein